MKLRYIGSLPITFANPRVGAVVPGEEFTVPDEDAPALLASSYLEPVEEETSETPEVTTKTDTDASPLKEVYDELPDNH